MKKKKKGKLKIKTLAEKVRRENEIKEYGRLLSLRPSLVHTDKTKYNRKSKHRNCEDSINTEEL